ncbi:MAG: cobalamin biosynthesis protein CobD, partial [Firmicutes bacterium]|nr:cobalamin biosynthesis protein CobD [Bacillota bacterium]
GRIVLLIVMSVLSWTCLSSKCLAKEALEVAKALKRSLEDGRRQVGRIVGRDTASLSEEEIIAATVETVAENTTDGVVSPLIYLLLGGPILAMGFKASSTLDSMEGYLDEKYRDIGWCGAKLDDALNYIPARLCGLLMCLSAALLKGLDGKNAFRIMKRDHANHLSPNCAWSESAAAGALHVQLGGSHEYFGKIIEKPTIGDADRPLKKSDILQTNRLMYATAVLYACALFALGMLV